jgi:hypothetical protein
MDLIIYTTPAEATVEFKPDMGPPVLGQQVLYNGRNDAHCVTLPDDTPFQGSALTVSCPGYQTLSHRGLLVPEGRAATFMLDDVHLPLAAAEPGPGPEPEPPAGPPTPEDAASIVQWVYETQDHDLSTHEGCGLFVEACCTALHDYNTEAWMHDHREPPQNQYNHHAVDACQCIAGPYYGMYDLIHDSVSPNASPCFNYVGPPNPHNACYPASSCSVS